MSNVFYTTRNGERDGRASHFWTIQKKADDVCKEQNARAEQLGVEARYTVKSVDQSTVDQKDVRTA